MTYLDLPLWPDQPARPNIGLESGFDRPVRLIVEVGTPLVQAVVPDEPNGTVLVVCPGGGYRRVCVDKEGLDLARRFARWGLTTLVVTYRQPGGQFVDPPLPQQDLRRALEMALTSPHWPSDPQRLILGGFSAGGHLALTELRHPGPGVPRPRWALLGYPVADLFAPRVHEMSRDHLLGPGAPEALVRRYSALDGLPSDLGAVFLVHADDDASVSVDNSNELQRRWSAQGVAVDYLRHPTGGHGFGLGPASGYPTAPDWTPRFYHWLETHGLLAPLGAQSAYAPG